MTSYDLISCTEIGCVTLGALRGLSGGAGPRALCSLAALKQMYAMQRATKIVTHTHHGIVVDVQSCDIIKSCTAALYPMCGSCWQQLLWS